MATTLEITKDYFISGDFDSRNRFLREDIAGNSAIVSGITWEVGTRVQVAGSSFVAYRFNIEGVGSAAFVTYSFNGLSATQSVPVPSNIVTRVSF